MATRGPPEMPSGQMPSSFDENPDFYNERAMQKVVRKLKEEPLVPLGVACTCAAFFGAWRSTRAGDSKKANFYFRYRVYAQGFTVVAMVVGGMYFNKDRAKSAELRKLQEQRDAEEKRNKWIRELEARDNEERAMKDHFKQKAAAAAGKVEETVESVEKGTGGILGKMGLWSHGEQIAKEEEERQKAQEAADAEIAEKKSRSPKSSLGTIGEIMASQKKDGKDEPKK